MVFLTVGMQLPFDRLVAIVDDWAGSTFTEVVAQIGASERKFRNIVTFRFLESNEFQEHVGKASVVVAHAGVGSILTAIEREKPIIVLPRRVAHGEHRSDHQCEMIVRFRDIEGVYPAKDSEEIVSLLNRRHELRSPRRIGSYAPKRFINELIRLIEDEQ